MDPVAEPGLADGRGDWVEASALGAREPLRWSEGGNSTMYRCQYRGESFVFKEYKEAFLAQANSPALGRLIAWRDGLSVEDRRYLDSVAAWPRHRVGDAGSLRGVLIPLARPEFFMSLPAGRPVPHTMIRLIRYTAAGVLKHGAQLQVKQRALGCAIEVLLWFHAHQVRVNDVHVQNILCTLDGRAVYFLDCDVMMGVWGETSPPAAPEHILRLVSGANAPTPMTDMARMAWAILYILLDSAALEKVDAALLSKKIPRQTADFLIEASRARPLDPVPVHEWRKLAEQWIKDGRATGRVPMGESAVLTGVPIAPPATHPHSSHPHPGEEARQAGGVWRARRPSDWVPDEFRRPHLTSRLILEPPRLRYGQSEPRTRTFGTPSPLLVSGIVFAVLLSLVLLATIVGSTH